ncbi:MAG TPA: response regulator, partial [Archangium sp.]|nr:response regulator [Archangium sp.]
MNQPPKKILLVDDSNTVLMMHRMLLHGQPYELLFARDGREAVEKAVANKPDLIFMDVMMPKLSGMEA